MYDDDSWLEGSSVGIRTFLLPSRPPVVTDVLPGGVGLEGTTIDQCSGRRNPQVFLLLVIHRWLDGGISCCLAA